MMPSRAALFAILAGSAALNFWNIGFPFGYHNDEIVKVGFILDGTQDFKHPLLLLEVVRLANRVFGFSDPQSLVILGRCLMAIAGAGTVWLSLVIASRTLTPVVAVAVAASVAVAPTMVVHAHYLKEDTLLTLTLMATLAAFLGFCRTDSRGSVVALGLALGLACASHYKALLIVPLILAAPALGALTETRMAASRFHLRLAGAAAVALAVWLLVNWRAVIDPQAFMTGARFELDHALTGHDVPVRWTDSWLGFHLSRSLLPGLSWPVVIAGIGGVGFVLARWRRVTFVHRLLALYVLVFYFVPEVSPLKPAPDYSRYMVPVAPVLIWFAWVLVDQALAFARARAFVLTAAAVALIGWPAVSTIRLVDGIANDTRSKAGAWLAEHRSPAIVEHYAGALSDIWSLTEVDLDAARKDGVRYLVASSFRYERYFLAEQIGFRDPEITRRREIYRKLFSFPHVEFQPDYRTFAFSNPVIRVIDIQATREGR